LDRRGQLARTLTVRVTEAPAETCTSGDWRRLEVLSERPQRRVPTHVPDFGSQPAWELEGSALIIDLNARYCDVAYVLRGHLTAVGVQGTHGGETPWGSETVGRFYGAPVNR
jgi:hypothetical protein